MTDLQLVTKAANYAAKAHSQHRRKDLDATPYINHLAEVAYLLALAECPTPVIAAGYLHDTALPGSGNTVLAGHAGIRGAVFRDLGALVYNDDIYLDAAGWRYHYRVRDAKSVWPNQVEVLDATPRPVLTLMTCTNWDTQRLVVVAALIDSGTPTKSPSRLIPLISPSRFSRSSRRPSSFSCRQKAAAPMRRVASDSSIGLSNWHVIPATRFFLSVC